ncbi:uncharacterized protein [Gossypium hirsutum]|uniref:Uncharacterized protein n=1 Tax=Gossypium hirsutum TaxID=3635 RepID=A0A1U8JPJ8_GOSHI|nr:uncharacterized protein LOC107907842 [Gossypium hirsutum]
MPNLETSETIGTPTGKAESQTLTVGDDALPQAMIRALKRVVGTHSRSRWLGGVIGVASTIAEYWLEATEHIMTDLDCTSTQKLRDVVSLFRDEAYQWWLTVEQGVQLEQRERIFAVLVNKAKIVEEVKCTKRKWRDREKDQNKIKRDSSPSGSSQRLKKRMRFDRPLRADAPVVVTEIQLYLVLVTARALAPNYVRPPKEVQQPFRGCGTDRDGNRFGRGQRAPGRGAGQAEACQPALVYAARFLEESNDANVIAGTFFIHSVPYYALIDIGSTHSYIASVIFVNLGLTAQNTAREFSVISPLDCLIEYLVNLDYTTKRVTLKSNENDKVVMVGERRDYLSNLISTVVAEKLAPKVCEAYLAYVFDYIFTKHSVGDIRTVKEFPDVFLEELPRVPPDREIEFGIVLLPGTAPVSIAHYCMAPKELTELKA